jgi:predicted glycosyltransferase
VRDPVAVNLLLRDFVKPAPPRERWVRGRSRRKRALYISSPIGLGHAQRDVAIADELRTLHPDLEIDWLAQHPVTRVLEARGERYDFAGYVTGFDHGRSGDRQALGYREDERVCIVTVGGSGVGADLLRRLIAAYPLARELVPNLRMVVVAGPRIDPASLPTHDGLEVRPYVHELYRHLAVCDLAVIQGGLTTAMELTASRRPFLYFPLRHHFEQAFHVRHRLERYGAGRCMDFERDGPAEIAAAIAQEIGRAVDYRPVETDGARRAAALIAELL